MEKPKGGRGGGEASSPQLIKKNVRLRDSGLCFQQSGEFKSKILPIKSIDVSANNTFIGSDGIPMHKATCGEHNTRT